MAIIRSLPIGAIRRNSEKSIASDAKQVAGLAATLVEESQKRIEAEANLSTEREAKSKLEKQLVKERDSSESHVTELDKERTMRKELEPKLIALQRDMKTLKTKLSKMTSSSAIIEGDLIRSKSARSALEGQLDVMQTTPQKIPDLSKVSSDVAKRLSPLLAQKRGKWDFEIVRGEDGRIARVIARPAT